MDTIKLKEYLAKRIAMLEKEWKEEADKERDPYDFPSYMKTIQIDAKINAYMEVLTMLS